VGLMLKTVKFVGHNPFNNDVIVDYDKRQVFFHPVKEQSLFELWMIFIGSCFFRFFVLFFRYPLALSFFLLMLFIFADMEVVAVFFFYVLMFVGFAYVLFSFVFSLNFFRRRWREEEYPKFNYEALKPLEEHYLKVNKDAVRNNEFILPSFQNIGLHYRVSGDFASLLQRIEVRHLFDGDDAEFCAVFIFRDAPVTGDLEIEYI
jgi:hypothetical protein